MWFTSFAALMAGVCVHTMAQTPPGTSPATDKELSVAYGNIEVKPGIKLPIKSVSTFLLLLAYT